MNTKTIEKYKGVPITIGSEVILYHLCSGCYTLAS